MTTQNITEAPPGWQGSLPEYIAYTTFESFGLVPGEDFTYQSKSLTASYKISEIIGFLKKELTEF